MTETQTLTIELKFTKPPAEVFGLLTKQSALEAWFCEHAEVDLARGVYNFWGEYTPECPAADGGHLRLLEYSPGEHLSYSWRIRGSESRVACRLEPAGSGSLLSVEHTGLLGRPHKDAMAFHDFWYAALENLRLYAAGGIAQTKCSYLPKSGPSLELEVEINGSAAEVFEKIADPVQIDRYFGDNSMVELVVGGRFDYGWNDGLGPIKVLELDAPHRLVYSWKFDEPQETVVTWQLADSGGKTRLTLTHSGFAADYESEGYRSGWFSFLAIIKGMVELGDEWGMVQISGVHGDA